MAELTPQDEKLIIFFRYLNKFMLFLWRLGLGNWLNMAPGTLGRYMVITHTGRKTGNRHRTPVNYAIYNNEIYCVAGFGEKADWFQNIMANPQVEIWLPDSWYAGLAEEIFEPELRLKALRQVLIASAFAGRMAGFHPQMSDEELSAFAAEYKLVHIRRVVARTGPGGPGDLAWIWPLATFLLLPSLFKRRKK